MTCYRRKSTVWPGKLISSKKTPKNSVFWRQEIGITSLWEDLEAKLLTPGQLLGYPWKVWGITVQTSYWEGRWDQNWVRSRPAKKSRVRQREKSKKCNLCDFASARDAILWNHLAQMVYPVSGKTAIWAPAKRRSRPLRLEPQSSGPGP